jgi:hypothetical protein
MKRSHPAFEKNYAAVREQIVRAHIGPAVAASEMLTDAIVAFTRGVKRFFATAATADNPALPAR